MILVDTGRIATGNGICSRYTPAASAAPQRGPCSPVATAQQPSAGTCICRQSSRRTGRHRARLMRLQPQALDAALPSDFEAKALHALKRQRALSVGIVGFGTFGQFLAKRLVESGHKVLATSRGDYHAVAQRLGVSFFQDSNDMCEEHPDVVILASSILSLETVVARLPVTRLRRSTLFVDVCSVKEFPKRLMLSLLPPEVDILCTHPMFGPDSGKGSWAGLNMMYEVVRLGEASSRHHRLQTFLKFFSSQGCRMVEMSCEEHDRIAASTQFITHTVGRVLGEMGVKGTPIDTRGYQSLLSLVDNTTHDSFELYYGLFMYNQSAIENLERLESAFDAVKAQLLGQLHEKVRDQLFNKAPPVDEQSLTPTVAGMLADASRASNGHDAHSLPSAADAEARSNAQAAQRHT